jgi:hypothetical protein
MQRREPAPARMFRARASQTGESLITRQSCQGHAEDASPRLRLAMQRRLETQHPDGISSKTLAAKVVCSASRLSYLVGAASQAAPRQTSRGPIVFFTAWEEQGPQQDPKEWHFNFLTTTQSVSRTVFHRYRLTFIS